MGVVAEPIVAGLLPRCIPLPHLYSLPHTHSDPSSRAFLRLPPCSSIIQAFARTHACARTATLVFTHTHTEEEKKNADAEGRAVGA